MATKNIQQATILHWPNENLKTHIWKNVKNLSTIMEQS